MIPLLLIQNISLTWDKKERGAKGAQARRCFPPAYPLKEISSSDNVIMHNLSFIQREKYFTDAAQENLRSLEASLSLAGFTPSQIQEEIRRRARWIQRHRLQTYASADMLNLTNLSVRFSEGNYSITFFCDEQRSGKPVRRGHNQDFQNPDSPFYGKDILNETAFILTAEQYGRILWNERTVDCDTGEWYWQLHIYNLYHAPDRTFSKDILVSKRPDFIYRQLAQ